MPLFEYQCKKCGAVTEVLVRRPEDEKDAACGQCGSKRLEKLLSTASVAVKDSSAGGGLSCGRDAPCCGRDTPCDQPSCAMR